MSMSIGVTINGETIGQVEVDNRTGLMGRDDVNTYRWHYWGDGQRVLDGTTEHRYGDGAMVLASHVLTHIASRYRAADA